MRFIYLIFISSFIYGENRNVSVANIDQFLNFYPSTKILQCTSNYGFNYEPFPLKKKYGDNLWYAQGVFRDMFILEVENGLVYMNAEPKENNKYSYFFYVNDIFIKECAHYYFLPHKQFVSDDVPTEYIKGRVAVVQHIWYPEYGHFMLDLLSSLALLEIYNVKYDYLLVPYDYEYMKEVLTLWGIDQSKIIPLKKNHPIKADAILFTTGLGIAQKVAGFGAYNVDFLIQYIRKKLLQGVDKLNLSIPFCSKVFLSKKDSWMGGRNIPNEDDVFEKFKMLGYERYEFSKMSMTEKIYRTSKATHLVSAVGSGGLHAIFMQEGGYYCEIQTAYPESTFCYLVQNVQMNYRCLDNTTLFDLFNNTWLTPGKDIPLHLVEKFIQDHPEL